MNKNIFGGPLNLDARGEFGGDLGTDDDAVAFDPAQSVENPVNPAAGMRGWRRSAGFEAGKRGFDIAIALASLPFLALACLCLLALNPFWNRGPLFYTQRRMGRGCRSFTLVKFRTMTDADGAERGPDDPVEEKRITPLGMLLRRSRIDELPQFLNVLKGDMSFIGPRPDFWDHAIHYADTIPGYRQRYRVRPGITGLAQVDGGYAEGIAATIAKTRYDLSYIQNRDLRLEAYILWRTFAVCVSGFGSR